MKKIVLTLFAVNLVSGSLLSAFDRLGFERSGFRAGMDVESDADITSHEIYGVTGYRWQHTSNAGIHDENDGLNMHTLGIDYSF